VTLDPRVYPTTAVERLELDQLDRIEAALGELAGEVARLEAALGVLLDTFGTKLPAPTRLRLAAALRGGRRSHAPHQPAG